MTKNVNQCIFVIADLHLPYQHEDAFDFIRAVLRAYNPDRVVQIGDEVDLHALSFHEHDPNLPSASDETDKAATLLRTLEAICPKLDLLESNHASLHLRKSLASGIPSRFLKSYNDVWGVGKGWKWHNDLILKTPNGPVYFHHAKSANVLQTSQMMGMSAVQGHHHNLMGAQYWGNGLGLFFGAQTGCLVDMHSLAAAYGKNNLKRPVLGSLIIKDGLPIPIPMRLNRHGRWDRKVLGK